MFKFFLDDSGRGGVFAVGGYLAHVDQWRTFEREWGLWLRKARVKVFHATDFYNARGEFKGWDDKKQRKYAKLFTATAADRTEIAIGRAVDVAAYQEFLAPVLAAQYWTPHGKVTPLMWCARTSLESLVVRHARFIPAPVPLAVIFEEGEGVGEVIDYMRGLQKRGAPWAQRFASFADGPKELRPLQAADLIVHEGIRSVHEKLHPSGRPKRKSMLRLVRDERVEIRAFSRQDVINALPWVTTKIADFERL